MTKKEKKAINKKRIQKQTRTEQRRAGIYRQRT
jgi:hypothetical protein